MTTLLEDVQLTLENDGRWHGWCHRSKNLTDASEVHWKNALGYYYAPARKLADTHRSYLREYFKWRYLTDQTAPPPDYQLSLAEQIASGRALVFNGRSNEWINPPIIIPPEKPVMSSKLTFKSIFYLNGVAIEEQSKTFIFEAIAAEEKRLEKLREIKHQPKALVAEIEAGEAAIQALVEHLDNI